MPTQEVACAARPSALLQCGRAAARGRSCSTAAARIPGAAARSLYTDAPTATLEVFPSGWGALARRRRGALALGRSAGAVGSVPADGARRRSASAAPGAGFLTVLSYELKHWIEALPRRLPWPRLPVLYCARYDWSYRANYRTGAARIAAARADALAERLRWYERRRCAAAPAP